MRDIKIKRNIMILGKDIVITVENENGHIGSVVIGEPYLKDRTTHVTMSTYNRLSHKDDIIARMYVQELVLKYHCVVTCVCGIHLDNITEEEINEIINWVKRDIEEIKHENIKIRQK